MTPLVAPDLSPVGVGVVGAGNIGGQYLEHLANYPDVEVRAVAARRLDQASALAARFGVADACSVDELLARDDVAIVVNLTRPQDHVAVSTAALAAGKHVWSEKPLAVEVGDALRLVDFAEATGLLLGVAPDTVLGAGLQHALREVRAGTIGEPQSAIALFQSSGPDAWHPDADFLFRRGAGPLLDVGPYYLTALLHVFGPVRRVQATGGTARSHRVIESGPRAGEAFSVEVPTSVGALLEFADGRSAILHVSFDSPLVRMGFLEVTGTTGTIAFPNPARFGGAVGVIRPGDADWTAGDTDGDGLGRGVGVVEMARAAAAGEEIRTSARVALHAVEVLSAIESAIESGHAVDVGSSFEVPPLLPLGWDPRVATLARRLPPEESRSVALNVPGTAS